MEQYIPKSALVAEIKRKYETNLIGAHSAFRNGKIEALREVKEFIDTLEVKEVDLNKSVTHYLLCEHTSPLNEIVHQADLKVEMQYHKDIENAFKAGFKLGLKAQKGE